MVVLVNLVDYQKYNTCKECQGKKDQNGYLQADKKQNKTPQIGFF